jgi:hypothetical protein
LTFALGLCHWRGVKLSERGAASRSFVIAAGAAVVAVLGYAAWAFLRPDPYSLSERIVRDARREVAAEVREFQREIDTLLRTAKQEKRDVSAELDKRQAEAMRGIDDVVDGARNSLSELDIAVRTQRNRMDRIDARADEAREMVKELAEEAKQKALGS